jgi:hypothetical protein
MVAQKAVAQRGAALPGMLSFPALMGVVFGGFFATWAVGSPVIHMSCYRQPRSLLAEKAPLQ